jgi:hypothetical protein
MDTIEAACYTVARDCSMQPYIKLWREEQWQRQSLVFFEL